MSTWISVIISGVIVAFVSALVVAWTRERTKRIIAEREHLQLQLDLEKNRKINNAYEAKKTTQDARAGEHIDDTDPWAGVQ